MSRLAKRPIAIPKQAEITISDGDIRVKGPKGTLEKRGHRLIAIEVTPEGVQVSKRFVYRGARCGGDVRITRS